MRKLTISGEIGGEGLAFAQSILNDLVGNKWIKDAIRAGLARDPGEARDGAALIFKAMQMRANEIDGLPLDDEN